jgi:TfoX/Sxy family transcriptional regulator of competence genes
MKTAAKQGSDLVDRVRGILTDRDVREQRMFGGVCFMLNGNMVVGTLRNELLVRVGKDANDAALKRPHARQMEMSRPAPGYVIVANAGTDRDADLKQWVEMAVAYVETLPPKPKQEPSRKATTGRTAKK